MAFSKSGKAIYHQSKSLAATHSSIARWIPFRGVIRSPGDQMSRVLLASRLRANHQDENNMPKNLSPISLPLSL